MRRAAVVVSMAVLVGCSATASGKRAADEPESAITITTTTTGTTPTASTPTTPTFTVPRGTDTSSGSTADATTAPDLESVSTPPSTVAKSETTTLPTEPLAPEPWFVEKFDAPDGLLTNEFAYRNSKRPDIVSSPSWDVTSGSLSIRNGAGWTGIPDRRPSEPRSALGNGSAVFRALATTEIAGNASVTMRLRVVAYVEDSTSENWDGAHVLLRYQDEAQLYAVSVARRDGTLAIKRKLPGGDSNDGRYVTLKTATSPVQIGRWHTATTTVADVPGGVEIKLWIDGELAISAVDVGEGGRVIPDPGLVGIRGDNVELEFDDLIITPLL